MPLVTAFYSNTVGNKDAPPPNRVMVNNKEIFRLFRKHNLILVMQGHLHVNEIIQWPRITFITGGAVCGKWWRGSYFGTGEGFNAITLRHDRVEWEYLGYGWQARRPVDQ